MPSTMFGYIFTRDGERSDNGSEFTAQAVRDWLKSIGVKTLYMG